MADDGSGHAPAGNDPSIQVELLFNPALGFAPTFSLETIPEDKDFLRGSLQLYLIQ
jgi:hypothetical protein